MPSKLKNSIGRVLRAPTRRPADTVHFHLESDGRAFVCDIDACDSVALTLGDLQSTAPHAR
jgi:hypothetical protein